MGLLLLRRLCHGEVHVVFAVSVVQFEHLNNRAFFVNLNEQEDIVNKQDLLHTATFLDPYYFAEINDDIGVVRSIN